MPTQSKRVLEQQETLCKRLSGCKACIWNKIFRKSAYCEAYIKLNDVGLDLKGEPFVYTLVSVTCITYWNSSWIQKTWNKMKHHHHPPKKLSSPWWQVFLFIWRNTWHLIFIFALSYVILNLASEILVAGKPEISAPVGDLLMMWKNKQLSFLSTSWIYPSCSCCIWYFNWKRMLAILPSNLTATCM